MQRLVKIVFSILLFTSFPSPNYCQTDECDHTLTSSSGILSSPGAQFTQESCKWTVVPPLNASSELLVKVISATLPKNVNLIVYGDDDEHTINKDCENCIDPLVTSTLKVFLQRTDNLTFSFSPKFNISYEEARNECAPPPPLKNGQIIGDNFKVGNNILFDCNAPYHIVGDRMAHCVKLAQSSMPKWDVEVPKCVVPKCSKSSIKLAATARWSSISNPGYEDGRIESRQKCVWDITAMRKDQRIRARLHAIGLLEKPSANETLKISIFDGSRDNLIYNFGDDDSESVSEITTKSSRMIVVFRTGLKVPLGASGFVLNYSSVSIECPDLRPPENGKIFPKRKSHGLNDAVKLSCDDGYLLANGSEKLSCTVSGEWSGSLGKCIPDSIEDKNITDVTGAENADAVYNSSQIQDYDPFSIKNESSTESYVAGITVTTETALPKPTKAKKKKAHYYTKSVTKAPKKPTMLYDFTKSTQKTKPSKYFEKLLTQVVKEQQLNKVKAKTTASPFPTRLSSPYMSSTTESVESVKNNHGSSMNAYIDAELVMIVAGISVPILLVIIVVLIIVIYRRYYPVRMGMGRKFSTFENPMYERRSPRRDLLQESQYLEES